jgi:hypothetical protein
MASRSLLARLGIAQELPVGEVASVPWTARSATDSLDNLVSNGHADPSRFEPFAWAEDASPGLTFARSRSVPELIRVEGPQVCSAAVVGSARRVGADALIFVAVDGSALRVGARLLSVEGDRLALDALASDEVEAQELRPSGLDADLARLVAVQRASVPTDSVIAEVFAGLELSEWLLDDATELHERGGSRSTAAALGLIARLYEAPTEDASALLASVLAGKASLSSARAQVASWWKQRSSDEVSLIEREALAWCDRAKDALAALSLAVEDDRPELSALARRWVRERDDLESLRESLSVIGRDAALSAALDALDADAAAHGTLFSELVALEGDRWSALGWQQPHLWWSGFTR